LGIGGLRLGIEGLGGILLSWLLHIRIRKVMARECSGWNHREMGMGGRMCFYIMISSPICAVFVRLSINFDPLVELGQHSLLSDLTMATSEEFAKDFRPKRRHVVKWDICSE